MQKKILLSVLVISICGIILSTIVFFGIQTIVAQKSADDLSITRLDDVEERILSNNEKLEELIEIVREDNLSRARALAMLIEMEPGIIEDNTKLEEIAAALDVDEIHIIDENGILRWGTQPFKYGMDFAAGDQTRPFLAILDDPELEISQAPMLNASLGILRQYAGVSLRHTKGIAEVGVIPARMLEAIEDTNISNVLHDITIGATGYMFSISNETGLISSHPDPDMIGIRLPVQLQDSGFMVVNGQKVRYHTRNTPDDMLVSALPTAEMYEQRAFSTSFFLIFIIILFILFCVIINQYIKRNVVTGIHDILGTLGKITHDSLDVVANVRSNPEFNELSDGINHMLSRIKDMIAEVSEAVIVAEEASKAKSSFLANMSHEIRTPMNAIIGMTELLLNEPLTGRQQGYVNDINISSHSLLSIINDILDFSKIEAGKMELSPNNYDFEIFLNNIDSMFKFVAQKKGLEFILEKEGEMPQCLYGDDVRLRQILTNICGNAVKFTSDGYIRMRIYATYETLVFEIEDTGMGIRKEELPKLFSAFVQADTQKNRNITGTGLGLTISKTFAIMMGGDITVDSVYGQGTIFTLTIPRILGDEGVIRHEDTENDKKSFFAPCARILVVDDNELNLKVAMGFLGMFSINAHTALSGREAIDLIRETDYDIVFMDHMMPEMDGIETTKEIRKLGEKYKSLLIIALTANAVQGAKEMFMSSGFNDFISKPIEINELIAILLKWLPPEKIEIQNETTPDAAYNSDEAQTENSFLDSVKKIAVIDTKIGLSRVSGAEKMYRETIDIFCKKLPIECDRMKGSMADKDLHNLTILAHSMKSSLSTIGAMELSDTAYKLETASRNMESEYCEEHLPGFLENLHALYEQLSAIIPKEAPVLSRPEGAIEYLQENVQAALSNLDDFEGDLVSEAIGKLLEYDFGDQTNALLENANNAVKDYNYDAATDFLNKCYQRFT